MQDTLRSGLLGVLAILVLAWPAAAPRADSHWTFADYQRVWDELDSARVQIFRGRCVQRVSPRNGRAMDEIGRCGDMYGGVSDEQVLIAQRSTSASYNRMAARACAADPARCDHVRLQAAAIEHTELIQLAAFTSEDGDGTVHLAADGTVTLAVSGATFRTPASRRLARMNVALRTQIAGVSRRLDFLTAPDLAKDVQIRFPNAEPADEEE